MLILKNLLRTLIRGFIPTLAFAGGETRPSLWRLPTADRLKERDKSLGPRLVITSLLGDVLAVLCALCASFWLRFHTSISEFGVPDTLQLADYFGYILLGAVSLICTLASFGIYERSALLRQRFVSLQILKACCAWFAVFMALALLFRLHPTLSRVFALISGFVVPVSLILWRMAFCNLLHHSAAAHSLRQRVLFVGWNPEAEKLARSFRGDYGGATEGMPASLRFTQETGLDLNDTQLADVDHFFYASGTGAAGPPGAVACVGMSAIWDGVVPVAGYAYDVVKSAGIYGYNALKGMATGTGDQELVDRQRVAQATGTGGLVYNYKQLKTDMRGCAHGVASN